MKKNLTKKEINKFQEKIFTWWKENKRDLPWRETTDPYNILVSEIMLQQTQVSRVIEKYHAFLERFPDVKSLAEAEKEEILELWSGLGYNRRALYLHETAKKISEMDAFPRESKQLKKLKGIGKYTSRSILIFAFNEDIATVDTNIRRIFIAEGFAEEGTSEKELYKIAEKLLPLGKSRDWHNALMDYGSLVKTSSKTNISPVTKQKKFRGSTRQIRGQILKYILEKKRVSYATLREEIEQDTKKLDSVLKKMIKEGLIDKNNSDYVIGS